MESGVVRSVDDHESWRDPGARPRWLDTMTATRVRPPDSFTDVAAVLGTKGGSVGCWCMFWRLTNQEIAGHTGADNEAALRSLIDEGTQQPGLVLFADDVPVGWASLAPRGEFHRIGRTKGLEYDASEAG